MHSWTGAYVADALDDAETAEFEAHLHSCDQCASEVASLRETMAEVSAPHGVAPPPALRASILDAIAATPMLPADEPADTHDEVSPVEPLRSRRRPFSAWLAIAAALLAVALGGVTVWQQASLQSLQVAEQQRLELLAAPDLEVSTVSLDGGQLTYLVSPAEGQAIVASPDLPDPGTGRSWQVWVMEDGTPRSGAVVDTGGPAQVWISDVAGGEALAITNEPRGGSPGPTGQIQAVLEF